MKTSYLPGEVVYSQGDPGHWFYVVNSGEFDVCVKTAGEAASTEGHGKVVHTYKGGKHMNSHPSFGEQALMYGKPRGATVVAKTPSSLWGLHRQAFQSAVRQFKMEANVVAQPTISMRLEDGSFINA